MAQATIVSMLVLFSGGGDAAEEEEREDRYEEEREDRDELERPDRKVLLEIRQAVAEIDPAVQRRLLRLLNQARGPEDLGKSPQEIRLEFEHAPLDRAAMPAPKREHPAIDFEPEFAKRILDARPVFGYRDLREVLILDWRRWKDILDDILELLGPVFYGRWDELYPLEDGGTTYAIMHAALLHTGKVLMLPSSTTTVLWDPDDPTDPVTALPGSTTGLTADLFCSGHSFLSDGRLLAVGGGGGSPGAASSIEGWKFDPVSETWQQTSSSMAYKRWYPTTVTLGEEPGRVLVASGWTTGTNPAPQMEVYDEVTDSFQAVTAAGPVGEKLFGQTYPGLHLLPGGETFYAPVGFGNCSQAAAPWPGTEPSGYFSPTSPTTGAWTDTGANNRTKGMSVQILRPTYPYVRVLAVGGGSVGDSATAQTINLSTFSPAWDFAFPLLEPRVHPNVVLLPDGKVFIAGGMTATPTPPPNGGRSEMYDPDTGSITEMDELNRPRHYHSVALLLPSGKVMMAGGASDGGCSLSVQNTIEVYSPPYLFRGPRPKILDAPATLDHDEAFEIKTPNAKDIAKVVFVRPMAVTHQTDSEQRVVPLTFHRAGGNRLKARAPDGVSPHSTAPRGYYMLFVVNSKGVPSEGRFVRLE